ncbi:hypothetical protein [Pseudoroseicyclus sp. CXY001]|uniref:hypothetical protein n=1 Tax=Pseudoroseicyclus sp. CXY001 TaxID=3242492 RepID=UPI0035716B35
MKRITRTHARLAGGARLTMDRSGLVTARPKVRMPVFPLRIVLHLVLGALLLKAALLAAMGAGAYDETLQALSSGSMPERVGAVIMTVDPVTEILAAGMARIF